MMAGANQYNTKCLYFPRRLTSALTGIFSYPLTVIDAPVGYGKTTAIREYLQNSGVDTLWQKVYDGGTDSFWSGFAGVFGELDIGRSQSLMFLGFPDDPAKLREAVTLIRQIGLPKKTALVIDDYHHADTPAVGRLMGYLAENRIEGLHIVLATRTAIWTRLDELSLKGCLHHVSREVFEFTPGEIMEYFKACGMSLSENEARQLHAQTDGWISALYLTMLDRATAGGSSFAISIRRLIDKAVYQPLSADAKEFLQSICIFDSLTSMQALYMRGKEDAGRILDELMAANAFLRYDSRLKTYSLHTIFREFLREELERKAPGAKIALYIKAAWWFVRICDYPTARRFFYEGGDFDGILQTLEDDKAHDYGISNIEELKKYFAKCPREIRAMHHRALLVYAMHLFVHKELGLFRQTCVEIEENIKKDGDLDPARRSRLLGEFELLMGLAEFSDLKKVSARYKRAWEYLNQPTSVYETGINTTFGCPSVLSLYYRESGRLAEHIGELKDAMPWLSRLTRGQGSGAEDVMEAENSFNRGEFDSAEICAQRALLRAREGGDENIAISARYFQTLTAFMKGDLAEVKKLMDMMGADMAGREEEPFIHTAKICLSLIYAYLDQADKIPAVSLEDDMGDYRLRFPAYPFYNVLYGRVMLIKKEYLKLIGSADHFLSTASFFSSLLGCIYTYIYRAAAYYRIFREEDAISSLKTALDLAIPDRQYMLFAENCDYIAPLLLKIQAQGAFREDINEIFRLYRIFRRSKEGMISSYFAGAKPTLTQRELEIASLASKGLTNIEIGKQLFISPNTVKMALKSVYSKLSIGNRALLRQQLDRSG